MSGIPTYDTAGALAPRAHGNRRTAAVVVVAAVVLTVAVLSLLLFSGVIRFGAPRLFSLTMASKIDGQKRAVARKVIFDGSEQRIYCCARLQAFEGTVLEARWYRQEGQVGGFSGNFGALTGTSTVRFLVLRGNVAFYLTRPPTGWVGGSYRVKMYIDGKQVREAGFSISSRAQESGTTTYRDPSGLFSMEIPDTWDKADPETLQGALVGFIGPGSGYQPRVVVVPTDFTSVDTAYLNGAVAQKGQQGAGQFQPYSIGNSAGARRDFSWDHTYKNTPVKLHTVQVVFQGSDGKIYSVDCHSTSEGYQANLPVFNSIINSLKVGV
jgi:hypothetical protein